MNRERSMSTEGSNGIQASWGHFLTLESGIMGATDTRCCEVALGGPARDRALGWRSTGLTASPPRGLPALLGLSVALLTSLLLKVPHTRAQSNNDPTPPLCRLEKSGSRGKSHWTWGVFI